MDIPWYPENPPTEQYVNSFAPRIAGPIYQLIEMLGAVPPMRVKAEEVAVGPLSLDASGRLTLPIDSDGVSADVDEGFLEAYARWSLAVRSNIRPDDLLKLEDAESWAWQGAGAWLVRRVKPLSRPGEGLFVGGQVLPLARWGRGGWRFWSGLEAQVGFGRALEVAESVLGAAFQSSESKTPIDLVHLRTALPDVERLWAAIGADIIDRCEGDNQPTAEEMSARDLQIGGVAEAFSLISIDLEDGPTGASQVEHPGGRLLSKGGPSRWREVEPDRVAAGTLLLALTEAGPWRIFRRSSPVLGPWVVSGADFGGQVFGVRGLGVRFESDGRLELDIGNAFVGPVTSSGLSMAQHLGVTGSGSGRWLLEDGRLSFEDLETDGLTIHERSDSSPLGMPSPQVDNSAAFFARSIESVLWKVEASKEALVLKARFQGVPANLRLSRT